MIIIGNCNVVSVLFLSHSGSLSTIIHSRHVVRFFYPVMFTFVVVGRPGPAVPYVIAVVHVFTFLKCYFS